MTGPPDDLTIECDPHPPLPEPAQTPYAKPHWDALQEERLLIQECTDCSNRQHFPRPWCQYCGSEDLDWIECSGRAELYSFSVPRRVVEVFEYEPAIPYAMGYIDLEEGVRIVSNVVGCEIEELEVGMKLEAVYDHVNDDVSLVRFQPA